MSTIRVVRRHRLNQTEREFASLAAAYRELAGTANELGSGEHQRMRAALRAGQSEVVDRYGHIWFAREAIRPMAVRVPRAAAAAVAATLVAADELTFGVEIECLVPTSAALGNGLTLPEGWRAIHDGSINSENGFTGREIVSPVLKGEEGIITLRAVIAGLNAIGAKINRSCGLHVHVGIRQFTAKQVGRIAAAFVANEAHFDSIMPNSRRNDNNRYCQSVRSAVIPEAPRSIRAVAVALNGGYDTQRHYTPYRYRKLNLQCYSRHGTIEFRQHSGSTDANKIANWVRLVTGFTAAAINGQVGANMTRERMITEAAGAEVAAYYEERAADLAA